MTDLHNEQVDIQIRILSSLAKLGLSLINIDAVTTMYTSGKPQSCPHTMPLPALLTEIDMEEQVAQDGTLEVSWRSEGAITKESIHGRGGTKHITLIEASAASIVEHGPDVLVQVPVHSSWHGNWDAGGLIPSCQEMCTQMPQSGMGAYADPETITVVGWTGWQRVVGTIAAMLTRTCVFNEVVFEGKVDVVEQSDLNQLKSSLLTPQVAISVCDLDQLHIADVDAQHVVTQIAGPDPIIASSHLLDPALAPVAPVEEHGLLEFANDASDSAILQGGQVFLRGVEAGEETVRVHGSRIHVPLVGSHGSLASNSITVA